MDIRLGISSKLDFKHIKEVWEGIVTAAREHGYKKVNLDLIPSPNGLSISVSSTGETSLLMAKRRPAAKSMDLICISDNLGAAYMGFQVLEREMKAFEKSGDVKAQPKLEDYNYGTTIGILPEFVQQYTGINKRLATTKDYLYAKGIVVEDLIKVTSKGDPIVNIVDRGQWQDNTKYFYNEYNTVTAQQETHDVWNYGLRWRCLQSQPVVDQDGKEIYFEPTWGSIGIYWQPIEGDMSLTMEFTSSNGYSFRRSAAWQTEIKPHIFFGSMEITENSKVKILRWERKHEVETDDTIAKDAIWNNAHTGISMGTDVKKLKLNSQDDISPYWSSKNKMIFTCYAEVGDGSNKVIVENQIIA
jgi:hypothetical protein